MNTYQFGLNLDFLLNLGNVLLAAPLLMTDRTLINALVCVCVCFHRSHLMPVRKEKKKTKGKKWKGDNRAV